MTAQEILDGITRHRANPIENGLSNSDTRRKLDEVEWALQAIAERMVEIEMAFSELNDKVRR